MAWAHARATKLRSPTAICCKTLGRSDGHASAVAPLVADGNILGLKSAQMEMKE